MTELRALDSQARNEQGRHVKPSRRKVGAFLDEWLDTVKDSIKPSTHQNYVDYTEAYIRPVIGNRHLQDVTVPILNLFYRHLLNDGRRKRDTNGAMYEYWRVRQEQRNGFGPKPSEVAKACGTTVYAARSALMRYRRGRTPVATTTGLAPKTVKNVHRLLHRAFTDAVAWNYIAFNPAEHASLPRQSRSAKLRPQPWTVEELAAWLRVARTDRFAAIWVLAATTGMRRSELAGIERGLLDLDTATLELADTRVVVGGHAADSDGKSDSGCRVISLDPFTVAALHKHVAMLDEERKAFGSAYPRHGKLVCFEDGKLLHPDTITRRFNRLVDRAGVRRIRLHDVRHTYATLSMDHGIEPKIVSDRVGHANMNVTFQIYTHRSTGHDRQAAEAVAKLITDALGDELAT